MNRRNFLKSAACLAAFPPTILTVQQPEGLVWNNWGLKHYVVSKGPYSVMFHGMKGVHDCHNLCATTEIAAVVVTQLQYSIEDIKKIWNIPWENTKERAQAWKDLRRIEVTKEEVMEIYNVMKALRGPHNCVPYPD